MTDSVSGIVPVYNGDRFLAPALDSILSQTQPPAELIVVDDGSTDRTPEILRGYGERIRVIHQPNAGPAAARNAGVEAAGGDFVAFLDADDLWLPEKLARQAAWFRDRPALMLCFTGIVNFIEGPLAGDRPSEWPQSPFSPCTMLCRRAVFDEVGLFNPALRSGEDTEWLLRVMMRRMAYQVMPEVLVRRRQHDRNLTRRDPPSQDRLLRLVKMTLDRKRREGW